MSAGARIPLVEVITHLPNGGAQRVALTLCERLDRSRFDVHLVAGPRGGWLERAKAIEGCTFHPARHLLREISPAHDLRVVGELARILKTIARSHPTGKALIHSHAPKAGVAARLAARRLGFPVVHTLHGLPYNTHMSRLKSLAYRGFERVGYWAGGEVISVTEKNRRLIVDKGWVAEAATHVIAPCVDFSRLKPGGGLRRILPRFGITTDVRVVAMVASLKPPKDPLGFLRAAAALGQRFKNARFVLVGDGDMRPQIEAEIRRLNMSDRVVLTGWLDPIEQLYPECDILALPSFSEGLPLTLIEARACGVPVVATRVGGVDELIADGENGLLVEPGNTGELALAIGRLLEDSALYERIKRAGLTGLERYRPATMVAEHEKIFERIWRDRTG